MIALWAMLLVALAAPLELDTVLERVDAELPYLVAAEARVVEAEARLQAARGAFDPSVRGEGALGFGKDPRQIAQATVGGKTPVGFAWEAGWKVGLGDVPPDEYSAATDAGGAWVAKAKLPLLDGLGLGAERLDRDVAALGVDGANQDLANERLRWHLAATEAYWSWVGAGARLTIAEELLAMAESRAAGIAREVAAGSRARIELLDNERVLFERREKVAAARGYLAISAQKLSLYYRDADGAPRVPSDEELPGPPAGGPGERSVEADVEAAMARPGVLALELEVEALERTLRAQRNRVLPELGLVLEHTEPLASDQRETVAGASLDLPLLNRKDRGKRDQAEAKLAAARAKLQALRDGVRADVLSAHATAEAVGQRVVATEQARTRAEEVARLERRRFELGQGELFTLLLREEKVVQAQEKAIDAAVAARRVEAELRALTGRE